jgi:D-2-hydroxyacid dehydrogenase (NADP+)
MNDVHQIRCPKPAEELTVLVHHDRAEMYLDEFAKRFPAVHFEVLTEFVGLQDFLERKPPDCVLSFRMPLKGPFPREVLLGFPSIRWLHATGAGIEYLPPWDPAKIMVTNSSGLHVDIMAEYITWAMLHQTLRMPTYFEQQKRHEWALYPVDSARGKTAVIVGMGRVGRGVARRLKAFGIRIIGVRRHESPVEEADETYSMEHLPEALALADFVILITPLTAETRGLFDGKMLSGIKRGAYFINVARGSIVDEAALCSAIECQHLKGATLDVFLTEPLPSEASIWDAPGVIVTPHVSGELDNWQFHAAMIFAENLENWLAGRDVINLCDPKLGY